MGTIQASKEEVQYISGKITDTPYAINTTIMQKNLSSYSPGPTKHFSCLVENGISRRLLLRKSQTSDELITNLNVALFTAYPKFKKDFVTSSSFQMTKAEEDQHIDYNEFLDSSNTKLKHPCQFLTTAVDFLQLVGFEFPVALSLFGDSMVVVLFSMPTG